MHDRWLRLSCRDERGPEETSDRPSIDQVIVAIRRLDGARYNELSIDVCDPEWQRLYPHDTPAIDVLHMCGGGDNRVAVMHVRRTEDGDWDPDYLFLSDVTRGNHEEFQVCGGQESSFPARWFVARSDAEAVATAFCQRMRVPTDVPWEHSLPRSLDD